MEDDVALPTRNCTQPADCGLARSPEDRGFEGLYLPSQGPPEGHPETRVHDPRSEFSQRLNSHTSEIRELIDRRLEEKLSKFAEMMQTVVRQAQELSGASDAPTGHTDGDTSSSSSSSRKKKKNKKRQRKRERTMSASPSPPREKTSLRKVSPSPARALVERTLAESRTSRPRQKTEPLPKGKSSTITRGTTSPEKVPGKSPSPSTKGLFLSQKGYGKEGDQSSLRPTGGEPIQAHSPAKEEPSTSTLGRGSPTHPTDGGPPKVYSPARARERSHGPPRRHKRSFLPLVPLGYPQPAFLRVLLRRGMALFFQTPPCYNPQIRNLSR